jgi:hypothetical protein
LLPQGKLKNVVKKFLKLKSRVGDLCADMASYVLSLHKEQINKYVTDLNHKSWTYAQWVSEFQASLVFKCLILAGTGLLKTNILIQDSFP